MANSQTNDSDKKSTLAKKVALLLENCILPSEKLSPTPSQIDGLDPESECELRILGCELIQISGSLLKLPQVAMATASVLFQRFYFSKSFVRQPMEVVAMACITLASKIEEAPRRIRDVINVCHHIKQVKGGKNIQPLILDQNYIHLKNQVIKAERRVLKELGFCVHVKHPHKIIVTLLEILKVKNQNLMQTAWNYMNDSLRTDVFVRYDPDKIACSCIHLSARVLQFPLPNKPAWYLVFGVTAADVEDISYSILSLYSRKKPDPERLEKLIEHLKKNHLEAKLKAKGISINNSLVNSSSQPNSPRNGTKSPDSDGKKDKNDKHNDTSPKYHHKKRRSPASPLEDGASPPPKKRGSKSSSSSGGGSSSISPLSPKRNKKTPPRGFKESRRSRSRSKTRNNKTKKHRSSHKRKRSVSLGAYSPPPAVHHSSSSSKKSYKSSTHTADKSRRTRSRSRSHDRNHHSNSLHEKSSSHKSSRKDRAKNHHSSRDKARRKVRRA